MHRGHHYYGRAINFPSTSEAIRMTWLRIYNVHKSKHECTVEENTTGPWIFNIQQKESWLSVLGAVSPTHKGVQSPLKPGLEKSEKHCFGESSFSLLPLWVRETSLMSLSWRILGEAVTRVLVMYTVKDSNDLFSWCPWNTAKGTVTLGNQMDRILWGWHTCNAVSPYNLTKP